MIKAGELRIGNWVCEKETFIKVENIQPFRINVETKYYEANLGAGIYETCYFLNDIEPIPLTFELLGKCGFEIEKSEWEEGYDAFLAPITIHLENDKTEGVYAGTSRQIPNCAYLHQLQNLYFALTGDELEINLP